MRQDGSPPGFRAWFMAEKYWQGASRWVPYRIVRGPDDHTEMILFRDGGAIPVLSRPIDLTWDWMDQAMAEGAMYGARG
jgi:hypothetical protein